MNLAMSITPTGCPVRGGMVFRLRPEHVSGTAWRDCVGGVVSNAFTPLYSTHNAARRYVRRTGSIEGIGFHIGNGYSTTGLMTGGKITIAAVSQRSGYSASDQIIRERTSTDSGTGILYPFKNASNRWGFFRKSSETSYEHAELNIGTYQNGIYLIATYDADTDQFTINYNGISGSGTTTFQSGNTAAIISGNVGRNELPIREIIAYNRVLSPNERELLQRYQKYDGGF